MITGDNGTIDGQGVTWWNKFHKGELKYTRPYLIEIMYSNEVQISNLTLMDSPSWNVHPVYSRFICSLSFASLRFHVPRYAGGLISCSNIACD